MKILSVVGARPNFMKVAPLQRAFNAYPNITSKIVHTGQHYDQRMSDVFFNQLELPAPDYYLGVGSGTHAEITAKVMIEFEKIVDKEKPDLVLVVGDVNSTLACALVTKKLNIKLAHVEAGLRSGDREMPEEINRIITDSIADYLFVTEQSGMVHLAKEGVSDDKVFFVGNVMIDSLCYYRKKSTQIGLLEQLNLRKEEYTLLTMHRPSNVDTKVKLGVILKVIRGLSKTKKVVFPLHPRTRKNLEKYHLFQTLKNIPNLILLEPQGYLEFLQLMENAEVIVTDSGGIQEESTFLKVPCLTIRDSTERPVTMLLGTNVLIPELNVSLIMKAYEDCLDNKNLEAVIPPFWDGRAAQRIAYQINKAWPVRSKLKVISKLSVNA